jgi:hypothetical protein
MAFEQLSGEREWERMKSPINSSPGSSTDDDTRQIYRPGAGHLLSLSRHILTPFGTQRALSNG